MEDNTLIYGFNPDGFFTPNPHLVLERISNTNAVSCKIPFTTHMVKVTDPETKDTVIFLVNKDYDLMYDYGTKIPAVYTEEDWVRCKANDELDYSSSENLVRYFTELCQEHYYGKIKNNTAN